VNTEQRSLTPAASCGEDRTVGFLRWPQDTWKRACFVVGRYRVRVWDKALQQWDSLCVLGI